MNRRFCLQKGGSQEHISLITIMLAYTAPVAQHYAARVFCILIYFNKFISLLGRIARVVLKLIIIISLR